MKNAGVRSDTSVSKHLVSVTRKKMDTEQLKAHCASMPGAAAVLHGAPSNIQIAQKSGDNTLDQTALNAVRHIDTFGPLPDAYTGSHINVTYYFDPPTRP